MRALKTVLWVLLVAALIAFTYANDEPVPVHIWPGLIWETKAPALVIGALLIGFVPTWLIMRAAQWRLSRRIATLEATLATQALALDRPVAPVPVRAEEPPVTTADTAP